MKNLTIKDLDNLKGAYMHDSCAYYVMDGILNALLKKGYDNHSAVQWLLSKNLRWAFDGGLGEYISKSVEKRMMQKGEITDQDLNYQEQQNA